MKYLLLALLLTGCQSSCSVKINNKTPMECGIEKAVYNSCFDKLGDQRRTNHVQFFTSLCEWKKETYPCKLSQGDLDSYVDYRCPPVTGCK